MFEPNTRSNLAIMNSLNSNSMQVAICNRVANVMTYKLAKCKCAAMKKKKVQRTAVTVMLRYAALHVRSTFGIMRMIMQYLIKAICSPLVLLKAKHSLRMTFETLSNS